ncbi:MAG: mandelate racemase/muconate lactonizing enzyme family protein [Burkholderiales bacterium]
MKIAAIETIQLEHLPNLVWVEVHTDDGLVGIGETCKSANAVAAHVHQIAAPYLLGKDPLQIESHNAFLLSPICGFSSTSAEIRAASAIDIALWDLFGKAYGMPVWQALGGRCHDRIRVYNTCASNDYNAYATWRRELRGDESARLRDRYDDLTAWNHHAGELACDLLAEGYTAMKIWPFDRFATSGGNAFLPASDIRRGLDPFEKIRAAVGDRIEIMCEMHSCWQLPAAIAIGRALRDVTPFWVEDPIRMDDPASLRCFRDSTGLPVTASETVGTRTAFRGYLEAQAVDYVMFDVGWCGGLTESRKIAAMADTYKRPIAAHDCVGPIVLMASIHLAFHAPNTLVQEVVRAFLHGFYRDLVTDLPIVDHGYISPPLAAGLGTALLPDLRGRDNAIVRRSAL